MGTHSWEKSVRRHRLGSAGLIRKRILATAPSWAASSWIQSISRTSSTVIRTPSRMQRRRCSRSLPPPFTDTRSGLTPVRRAPSSSSGE